MPDFTICGNCYAVITKDTNLLKSARDIPSDAVLVEMNLPILNNDWDRVVLKNNADNTIDSLYYEVRWGTRGISLERKSMTQPATNAGNLVASQDPSGATCGFRNSVVPYNYDLSLAFSDVNYQTENIDLIIKNEGENLLNEFNIMIYAGAEFSINEKTLFKTINISNLFPSEDETYSFILSEIFDFAQDLSFINLLAVSDLSIDENPANDTAKISLSVPLSRHTVLINEIMYDMSQGRAEYVELYNISNSDINLHNWVIANRGADFNKGGIKILDADFIIPAKSYSVVAWDSVIFLNFPNLSEQSNIYVRKQSFNLRQASDDVVLYDSFGAVQDSMTYFNNWHNNIFRITKDISLEKLNPYYNSTSEQSWSSSSSEAGGTPGKANSIFSDTESTEIISCHPNPFSPTGVGSERICTINYALPYSLASLNAFIFDMAGTRVKELASGLYTPGSSSLTWDGTNNDGSILPDGAYILYLDASCADTKKTTNSKILIVIGSK